MLISVSKSQWHNRIHLLFRLVWVWVNNNNRLRLLCVLPSAALCPRTYLVFSSVWRLICSRFAPRISLLVLTGGMGIKKRFHLRTGSELSDNLESYASKVIDSFYRFSDSSESWRQTRHLRCWKLATRINHGRDEDVVWSVTSSDAQVRVFNNRTNPIHHESRPMKISWTWPTNHQL